MTSASKAVQISPSHVALLVPSVKKAAEVLRRLEFQIGEEEAFEAEGTKEIYVEYGKSNSLLLLEAAGPGAYRRALEKRGPGIHHLAIDVLDLDLFLLSLPKGGWALHEVSAKTIKKTRTAWLYSKGFPALIEVQEREKLNTAKIFVGKISLPVEGKAMSALTDAIGLTSAVEFGANELNFVLNGKNKVSFKDLV